MDHLSHSVLPYVLSARIPPLEPYGRCAVFSVGNIVAIAMRLRNIYHKDKNKCQLSIPTFSLGIEALNSFIRTFQSALDPVR